MAEFPPPCKRPSMSLDSLTPEQVAHYIHTEVPMISLDILETLKVQKIDGEVLLEMSDGDFLDIAPCLGDRLKLKKAVNKARGSFNLVSLLVSYILIKWPAVSSCFLSCALFFCL